MHRCGVTFVLDRAGVTGPDGASHHGMWDMSILQLVPGLRAGRPAGRDPAAGGALAAVAIDDAPSVIRYSKEPVPADLPAVDTIDGVDVLLRTEQPRGAGRRLGPDGGDRHGGRPAAGRPGHRRHGRRPGLGAAGQPGAAPAGRRHSWSITIEDSGIVGGCGARLAQELRLAEVARRSASSASRRSSSTTERRAELLTELGLTPQHIARYAVETIVRDEDSVIQGQRLEPRSEHEAS